MCATLVALSPESEVRRYMFNVQHDRPYGEFPTYVAKFWITFCETPARGLRDVSKMYVRVWALSLVFFLRRFTAFFLRSKRSHAVCHKFTVAPSTFILLDLSEKRIAASFFGSLPLHPLLYRAVNLHVHAPRIGYLKIEILALIENHFQKT